MSSTKLAEADRKFGAALDQLRRKYLGTFSSWLNAALAKNPRAAWQEVPQRISLIRKQLAEEFISVSAPAVVETLNADAKRDIVQQLRLFDSQVAKPASADLLLRIDDQWRPGPLRAVLGAAIGAAAALLLLALQASGPAHDVGSTPPGVVTQQPMAPTSSNANNAAPPTAPPAATVPAAPVVSGGSGPSDEIEQTALRIIAGAFGAALGAFAVVCPPLRILLARFGLGRGSFGLFGKLGITFLLVRRVVFALTITAVLIIAAAFIGLVFIGPKPAWNVLFALAAILAIVLARYTVPSRAAGEYAAMEGTAINALDHQVRIDADVLSALAAGMVVHWTGAVRIDPQLDRIRSVIVGRRQRKDSADSILRVVEQELRLSPGGGTIAPDRPEFIWQPESAEQYETLGVVEAGDTVTVMAPPHLSTDASGAAEVFQKGKVIRKRAGT